MFMEKEKRPRPRKALFGYAPIISDKPEKAGGESNSRGVVTSTI